MTASVEYTQAVAPADHDDDNDDDVVAGVVGVSSALRRRDGLETRPRRARAKSGHGIEIGFFYFKPTLMWPTRAHVAAAGALFRGASMASATLDGCCSCALAVWRRRRRVSGVMLAMMT